MTADELKRRTKQFGLRVLKLVSALPNTIQGRAIGNQLVSQAHPLARIIVLLAAAVQKLNLLQSWE